MMKICPKCKEQNPDSFNICEKCGAMLDLTTARPAAPAYNPAAPKPKFGAATGAKTHEEDAEEMNQKLLKELARNSRSMMHSLQVIKGILIAFLVMTVVSVLITSMSACSVIAELL